MIRRVVAACLAAACFAEPVQADMRTADLKAQLDMLSTWWPGRYDNHEQVVRQSGGGLSALVYAPFERLHTVVDAVKAPASGEHVFYVRTYRNGDEARPVRAEIDVVTPDLAGGGLRMRRLIQTPPPLAASESAPDVAALRAPDSPAVSVACDVVLRYVGGQFEGAAGPGSCAGAKRATPDRLVIGPRYFWTKNPTLSAGAAPGWHEQTRARLFTCTVFESADGVMEKTRYLRTIRLHDQGGEADIAWPDGRTLTFTIHTRAFTTPADRENPLFRIHEKGKTVPIAYAYAVDGTRRFGLNLGWFYIRCYAEGDENPLEPGYTPPTPKRRPPGLMGDGSRRRRPAAQASDAA